MRTPLSGIVAPGPRWRLLVALAALYVLAGKLGLAFASVHASATPLWAPTGIAFAAFLLYGSRVWPVIFLSAFLVNVTTAGSVATSLGIATGNTIEGWLGAYLVGRFANGRLAFDRARDIFKFAVLAGIVSTAVSATAGVTSLSAGGFARWEDYGAIWATWWLGNLAGDLIVAPVLVLWSQTGAWGRLRQRPLEAALLLLTMVAVALVVFGGLLPPGLRNRPVAFLCLPALVWVAFRFGQRETATAIVILSAFAVAGTLRGVGPFASSIPNQSLLVLQAFMATMAVTMLPVAALVWERRRIEDSLRGSEERYRLLADAMPQIMLSTEPDGRCDYCNQRWHEYTGLSFEQSRDLGWLSALAAEDAPAIRAVWASAAGRARSFELEARVRRADGIERWHLVRTMPVTDGGGRVTKWIATCTDVEDTKRVEVDRAALLLRTQGSRAEAEVARRRFQDLLNDLDAIVWEADAKTRAFTFVGERAEAVLGYAVERWLTTPDFWANLIHVEDRDAVVRYCRECAEQGRDHDVEYRAVAADGRVVWLRDVVRAVRSRDGDVEQLRGLTVDITQQKGAAEQLRARARQQAAVAVLGQRALSGTEPGQVMDEAVALIAETLDMEFAELLELLPDGQSLSLRAGVGWTEGAVGRATVGVGRDSQAGYTLLSREPVVVEDLRTETRFASPPLLAEHAVASGVSVIVQGRDRPFGVLGTHTTKRRSFTRDDVHFLQAVANVLALAIERQRADEERATILGREQAARAEAEVARENAQRVQSIVDAALGHAALEDLLRELLTRVRHVLSADTAAIFLLDAEGQQLILRAADGLEATAQHRAIPVGAGFTGQVAAERRPLTLGDIARANLVTTILRDRGVRSLVGVPLLASGRVIGVVRAGSVRRDAFTDEDGRLLQLAAERMALAIDNSRLYEAERHARALAEAANRAKDEFLAVLSHELRTPLTAMLGWVRMLRSGILDEARTARALEIIERNTRLQAQLIDDLLDMSRVVSGKLQLDTKAVDLVSVVDAALDGVRGAAETRGVRLETALDPPTATVKGDAARLQQVMWNLLTNAVKFTLAGGRVMVGLDRLGPSARITVQDTGKGIGADVLPHIFDRFWQAESSSTRYHGGLGLGLTIVRELVELHGGSVQAQSAGEGQGATFTVMLPVLADEASPGLHGPPALVSADRQGAAPELPTLDGLRVLVVEDEPDTREFFLTALREAGAQVTGVGSVDLALDALRSAGLDVLVADISMPGRDGHELIRDVRALGADRGRIPAVAVTANARAEDRERALAAGYDVHVAKPLDPAELCRVVARLTKRR